MACNICPRNCQIDRTVANGFCGCSSVPRVARAALHYDEEPCISGANGSGTVFFSGCNLKCVFCQNTVLQDGTLGERFSLDRLTDVLLKLQEMGAHNINLVTPTPHRDILIPALRRAKQNGLTIPVLYNTNAYESANTIRAYDGLIDLYLPDFKYHDNRLAVQFSKAPYYFETALSSISEMVRQVGFMQINEAGLAERGVRIRHLVLPGCVYDTRDVLDTIAKEFGTDCPLSIMSQYTPMPDCQKAPLNRRLTKREYDSALDHCISLGFTDVYMQGFESVGRFYTPSFSDRVEL